MNALFRLFGRNDAATPRIGDLDESKVARLYALFACIPTGAEAINVWTRDVAALLDELVLQNVASADIATILAGLISFRNNGVTSDLTQHALINGYCSTNGLLQDVLHKAAFVAPVNAPEKTPESPFFGRFDDAQRAEILRTLNETGYAVLPRRLSAESLASMNDAARKMTYSLRANEQRLGVVAGIDPENPPACVTADADDAEVLADPLFSALYADPQILNLIETYLASPIVPVAAGLRYTFPSAAASDDCAQTYHYDLDTVRWLKVFCYLNDVGLENGPHAYIDGSHRPGAKSPELLRRHYDRIPDADIHRHQRGDEKMLTGVAGTVAIGDTRAWHKGLHVAKGYRLLFFPYYAPSKFSFVHGIGA
jgi:hypothetical protein